MLSYSLVQLGDSLWLLSRYARVDLFWSTQTNVHIVKQQLDILVDRVGSNRTCILEVDQYLRCKSKFNFSLSLLTETLLALSHGSLCEWLRTPVLHHSQRTPSKCLSMKRQPTSAFSPAETSQISLFSSFLSMTSATLQVWP